MADRRDSLGRRIGRNWWRELNCSILLDATLVWERDCEELAIGYGCEIEEYAASVPRPNLKDLLVRNAGMNTPCCDTMGEQETSSRNPGT